VTEDRAQTERVLGLLREVLGDDLLGAYEHGSAVLGGLQPTSDLDILVVTGRPATLVEKRRLVEGLLAISAPFPPPGPERCVEVTVVVQARVRPWRYPPSFDLQYGEWLRTRFEDGDSQALAATVNADLTTLLTIVLLGDRPLLGPPPAALLDPALMRDCVTAMLGDLDQLMDKFEEDTGNLLLRLARIWQTVVTGVIDRKDRAAEWARERLPPEHRPLMERARAIYLGRRPDDWSGLASEARAAADHMISRIRQEAARRRPGQVPRLASRPGPPEDDPFGGRRPTSHERLAGRPWDASYHDGPAPWDVGRPQPAVVRLASQGVLAGPVLDAGCGTGENALHLASLGLAVLGVDVAGTALAMARAKADERGIEVAFALADALRLEGLGRRFATVLDCGLFHTFDGDERPGYVASLASVTEDHGTLYVLCFSDVGPDTGPHPVSQEALRAAFHPGSGWRVAAIEPERVLTRFHDHGAPAWLATVERVPPGPAGSLGGE
jgi:SAM-dependent methyltransferase/predicted nucleotidyltransferase